MSYSTKALYTVAFLVIAGSVVFIAIKGTPASRPITTTQPAKPTAAPTATASASPSTSGTLYVNTAYGYEFTYPNALTLGDKTDPRTPVSGTTQSICATQPGSGTCSFGATLVTTSGPATLTDSYVESVYPNFNAQYDILSNTTLNGLSGIQVANAGRDIYIETSAGVVLDFFDGQDKYSASILPTVTLTK
jgi:hypothetical protein